MRTHPRRVLTAPSNSPFPWVCLVLLIASFAPHPVSGQGGHPLPRQVRPLHERLAVADAVAVATIGEVQTGRIELLDVSSLLGNVPQRAQLKRSPSLPLEVSAGDRVLLLLRGARSPYLSVDAPRETVVLSDPADEARWSEAIRTLDAAREQPEAWAEIYSGWLDSDSGSLRDLALASLADVRAPFQPLPGSLFAARAAAAWDPARSLEVRRTSAQLAALQAGGAAVLASHAARCDPELDPEIFVYSVTSAVRYRAPDREPALLCALSQPLASIRLSALRTVGRTGDPVGEDVTARIAELHTQDDDASVRDAAERALARLR
ncbi:MAG: hypothetical protein ACR2PQ_10655 [Myxococcota bacterium]